MDGPSAVEFLQSALQSAELYSGALRDCIAKCAAGASSSEVQSVLHEEGSQAIEFLQAQMQGWQGLLGHDMPAAPMEAGAEHATPLTAKERAARMGKPALGGGLVLPKLTPQHLQSLSSTNSPAGRELRGDGASQAAATQVATPEPAWLTDLKRRKARAASASAGSGAMDALRGPAGDGRPP